MAREPPGHRSVGKGGSGTVGSCDLVQAWQEGSWTELLGQGPGRGSSVSRVKKEGLGGTRCEACGTGTSWKEAWWPRHIGGKVMAVGELE